MVKSRILLFSLLVFFLTAGNALALGINITIWDKVTPNGSGVGLEDNEVEWNCTPGQIWDLEGFFLDDTKLTMVGGFNFKDGEGGYQSGDIFIDTDGNAVWGNDIEGAGNGNTVISNADYKYDYAIDLVFDDSGYRYDVYKLNDETLMSVFYGQNGESNPWQLESTEGLTATATGEILWAAGLSDSEVGGLTLWDGAGMHYSVGGIDLSFLGTIDNTTFHYTYQCGNDNLMAHIPDASALVLLGSAMVIVGLLGRKRRFSREA